MTRFAATTCLALLVMGSGCRVPIAHLTAATPTPVPAGLGESRGRHVGRACRWWVLGVPLGLPQIEEAMNDALARGHGRLLRDVTISSDHDVYLLLGRNCYTVAGELIA